MVNAVACLVPCVVIPMIAAVYGDIQTKQSLRREIDLLKRAGSNREPVKTPAGRVFPRRTVSAALLVLAVAALAYGYLTGGTADVLTKAINICTECVGLG